MTIFRKYTYKNILGLPMTRNKKMQTHQGKGYGMTTLEITVGKYKRKEDSEVKTKEKN